MVSMNSGGLCYVRVTEDDEQSFGEGIITKETNHERIR